MPETLPKAFSGPLVASPNPNNPAAPVHEGWVLKKRRKKMQGFARRYFVLFESGILSYAFEPGKPVRDQIQLQQATISTSRNTKDIHVDSGNATFHIKCLDTADFDKWMAAFKRFVASPTDPRSLGRKSSVSRAHTRLGQVNKTSAVIEEMGSTIAELERSIEALNDGGALKRVPSKNLDKPKEGKEHSSKFSLFGKKGNHHLGLSPRHANGGLPDEPDPAREEALKRLHNIVGTLKEEHATLVKLVTSISAVDLSMSPALGGSPMPAMMEEMDRSATPKTWQRHSARHSVAPSVASTASEWYDAPDDLLGEAIDMDSEEPSSQSQEGPQSQMQRTDSEISTTTPNDSELDEDDGSDTEDEYEEPPERPSTHTLKSEETRAVVRRQALPSGPVGDEGSLFAVMKKNIGKDLSSIVLPVSFNEPLTLLQRAAEEVEYSDLLTLAAQSQDPIERLCYVAAFAVSGYAHTRHRSSRKGFNPLLAETFEEPRMKFIAEKVSHRPVIMAYHAEGPGWEQYSTVSGKTKFWGKSLEIIPTGINHARFGDELYEWRRPSSFMRNIMMGTKYLEHTGKMTIECTTSKARCVIEFKENGYWNQSNEVVGTVYSSTDKAISSLEGNWDQSLQRKIDSSHLHVLWRITPFPKHSQEQYGLTTFAMTLNEITPDLEGRLPPTDSRLRPDVRALEEGRIDDAEHGKEVLEGAQRQRRQEGKEREPRWFKQEGEEWIYKGGYWETRDKGWKDVAPLW